MSITTKTGDDGTTGLWSGERVGKDDLRVEAYGTIDELMSFMAFAWHEARLKETKTVLREVSADLFRAGGELASVGKPYDKPIGGADVARLEARIGGLEGSMKIKGFVVPGTSDASARIDVARAVARRAERRIVSLARTAPVGEHLKRYMNRLSDLLFLMARAEEDSGGGIVYL